MFSLKTPLIIHQIWSGIAEPLPKKFEILSKTWKYDYPDWRYEFWDNNRMNSFVRESFPQYWKNYKQFPYNIQKWDAIRYLILKKIGGMYVDFDYESIKPLDELIQNKTCCFSQEPTAHSSTLPPDTNFTFNNALMLSIPNHPFMDKIIEKVFSDENVAQKYDSKALTVIKTTGPYIINQIYKSLIEEESSQIFLIPAKFVSPFSVQQSQATRKNIITNELESCLKDAYAVHYYLGSWLQEKEKLI